MLRADVVIAQIASLILRDNDDLPGTFGKALEHRISLKAGA
jgi:hypothetical protein